MRLDIVSAMSSISALLTDLKRIQTPQSLFWDFGADKTFVQAAEFKFESKFKPLLFIWQSLLKSVPEDNRRFRGQNRRFRGQNQWPSSWGSTPARLARVGRASTNTGRFRVGSSRCGPRPKTYCHSCDTDLVRELRRF